MSTLLTKPPPVERPVPPAPPERLTVPRSLEKPARLTSLDAYRGLIMLAMASSSGFALAEAAKHFRGNPVWDFVGYHTDHVAWVGCGFWDLIQPAFMFMAGVAIPYSYASRKAKGESDAKIYFHIAVRSLMLVLLGIFLSSNSSQAPGHILVNVLSQIGLGYFFVSLLRGRGLAVQLGATAVILVGYWLWFALYPLPPAGFDYRSVGLPPDWAYQTGFFAHWEKHTNAAAAFDMWLLNLFPAYHPKPVAPPAVLGAGAVGLLAAPGGQGPLLAIPGLIPTGEFLLNKEGYPTLNFIPSMATMIFGLLAGELLRGPKSSVAKLGWLVAAGAVCLALGQVAGWTVCPIVKRIWTPSFAVYSAGWTFLMLAGFYAVCDLKGWKRWAFPLIVVGLNSIAIYLMSQLLRGPIKGTFRNLVGEWWIEQWLGSMWLPTVECVVILAVLWLACWWLYRRNIFVRI
jgi:predicted acyltransferase